MPVRGGGKDAHETSRTRWNEYRRPMVAARSTLSIVAAKNPTGKTATGRAPEAVEGSGVRASAVPAGLPKIP